LESNRPLSSIEPEKRYGLAEFRELGLLDGSGRPRLASARHYFCDDQGEIDLELLGDLFQVWRDLSEAIVMREILVDRNVRAPSISSRYFYVKCAKRGNDVYQRRVKQRFSFIEDMEERRFFEVGHVLAGTAKTPLLWITLTYDTKRCSRREAWENVGKEYNRWISALRRRYGRISAIRNFEAYSNGYPHVHAILWFHEKEWSVFAHFNEKQGRMTYRIQEKREFEDVWHEGRSFSDIEALNSVKKAVHYVKKYQMKVAEGREESIGAEASRSKGVKTLAFMWLFRKRSYSLSGEFRGLFSRLDGDLHNSNMEKQTCLDGSLQEDTIEASVEFVGVFSMEELGVKPYVWYGSLDRERVESLVQDRGILQGRV
jgi:hypothetical protein